jgi:site-specific recombinase XerC
MTIENFLKCNKWSNNTKDRYRRAVTSFLAEIPAPADLTPNQLYDWLFSHAWGSSSRWVAFCAVRKYLAWRYGATHPALSLEIRRDEPPPQRSLTLDQVNVLLASFPASPLGCRDLAMCSLFIDSALRVSEICRLDLRYLDLKSNLFQVLVKGGQWRFGVFGSRTSQWIADWLDQRNRFAAPHVTSLFVSVSGSTPGQAMTPDGVKTIVRRWGERAGITPLSPHDFRRTFGSLATILGSPEDLTMKAGGWKTHTSFRRYTVGAHLNFFRWFPTDAITLNREPTVPG